jgi:hypothetical protein
MMEERSPQKGAFTIVYNYRNRKQPKRKASVSSPVKAVRRVRRLTMDVEEIEKHMELQEEPSALSANPEFSYHEASQRQD